MTGRCLDEIAWSDWIYRKFLNLKLTDDVAKSFVEAAAAKALCLQVFSLDLRALRFVDFIVSGRGRHNKSDMYRRAHAENGSEWSQKSYMWTHMSCQYMYSLWKKDRASSPLTIILYHLPFLHLIQFWWSFSCHRSVSHFRQLTISNRSWGAACRTDLQFQKPNPPSRLISPPGLWPPYSAVRVFKGT